MSGGTIRGGLDVAVVLGVMLCLALAAIALGALARRGRRKGYRGPFLLTVLIVVGLVTWVVGGFGMTALVRPHELDTIDLVPPMAVAVGMCWFLVACLPARAQSRAGTRRVRFPFVALTVSAAVGGVIGPVVFLASGRSNDALHVFQIGLTLTGLSMAMVRRTKIPQLAALEELGPDVPVVVLLRNFQDERLPFSTSDAQRTAPGRVRRWAARLAGTTSSVDRYLGPAVSERIGLLVGLGNPLDYLPPEEGMVRSYATDEGWQAEVHALVPRARAVLVAAGASTRSLDWELGLLRRGGHLARTFLVLPRFRPPGEPGAPRYLHLRSRLRGARPAPWAEIVCDLGVHGLRVPTAYPGPATVIGFDNAGHGRVVVDRPESAHVISEAIAAHLGDPREGGPGMEWGAGR